MYEGKFGFQNRLGQPYSWKDIYRFSLFYFVFEGNFQVQAPRGAYIWRGDLTEGVLRHEFGGLYLEGLIHGGAYFRNFTVFYACNLKLFWLHVYYNLWRSQLLHPDPWP